MPRLSDPGIPADIGERIRRARLDAGLTQEQAAELLKCRKQHVGQIENGQTGVSLAWLWRFAEAVGCDPNSLDPRLRSVEIGQFSD